VICWDDTENIMVPKFIQSMIIMIFFFFIEKARFDDQVRRHQRTV